MPRSTLWLTRKYEPTNNKSARTSSYDERMSSYDGPTSSNSVLKNSYCELSKQ
jgi:ribosomal protein L34